MGFQPFPVLEKGAKQQSDLSMLIASGPGGNKRAYRKLCTRAWLLSRLLVLVDMRLFAQHSVEQRGVNLYVSVVIDESLFPELVHEKTHPGSGGADHFRQGFLTKRDGDWRCATLLTEIREKQKQAREASFAGIEELVDQVVFDPGVSGQQVVYEKCGKLWFRVEGRKHCGLCHRRDQALFHGLAR